MANLPQPAIPAFIRRELSNAMWCLDSTKPTDEAISHAANTLAFTLIEGDLIGCMADHWQKALMDALAAYQKDHS